MNFVCTLIPTESQKQATAVAPHSQVQVQPEATSAAGQHESNTGTCVTLIVSKICERLDKDRVTVHFKCSVTLIPPLY